MKQLYESILSSTSSGRQKYIDDCEAWFRNTLAFKIIKSSNTKVNVERNNGRYSIYVTDARSNITGEISFNANDVKEFLFDIDRLEITKEGKTTPENIKLTYINIKFDSTKQMIKNIRKLSFLACSIDDFDGRVFENDFESLHFDFNMFAGFGTTYVNKIHDVNTKFFRITRSNRTDGTTYYGLTCKLKDIKNVTIESNFISLTPNLFETDRVILTALDCFSEEAGKELDLFLKNNKVKLEKIIFRTCEISGYSKSQYAATIEKHGRSYDLKWTTVR